MSGDHPSSQLENAAKDTVSKLAPGQIQSIFDADADSIKAGNTPDTVAAAWHCTVAVKGPLMNEISTQKATEDNFVDVRYKFANGDVIVRVEFAPSLELTGTSCQAAPYACGAIGEGVEGGTSTAQQASGAGDQAG